MTGNETETKRPRPPRRRAFPFITVFLALTTGGGGDHSNTPQWAASAHGYMSSPRSRNLVAHEDTVWWPLTSENPEPETCPHCLNRGGVRARCGLVEEGTSIRNYDAPKNAIGGAMPPAVQANYTQGQEVVLDVVLTAHHKGHFVFSACPISSAVNPDTGEAIVEVPTQGCFDRNRLTFVEDLLYGANPDPSHPERAYIAPVMDPSYVLDPASTQGVMDYSFRMRLPPDVYGDLVLIQWYYLTANSCYHAGYKEYSWPAHWNLDATSSMPCGYVSPDGDGVPEQFWNCAEVRIERGPYVEAENSAMPTMLLGGWCFPLFAAFLFIR